MLLLQLIQVLIFNWLLSFFLFAFVVDVVTEFVREGVLSELLYAEDLFFIINFWKTDMMVSECITNGGLSNSRPYRSGICGLRVKANLVLCIQYSKWM